ncbi:hypothetical protein Y032_0022g622 [Ancylostoma ceylanicum]|uniref:Uncharacterized protein n=1 Tax=Ancylostoma ceylanicum TaxID=53326 RepID=A0A016V119_9BILA|nr:hypothetical protein Y032_0022g622 [Ancylostoma ceylanicum]
MRPGRVDRKGREDSASFSLTMMHTLHSVMTAQSRRDLHHDHHDSHGFATTGTLLDCDWSIYVRYVRVVDAAFSTSRVGVEWTSFLSSQRTHECYRDRHTTRRWPVATDVIQQDVARYIRNGRRERAL